MSRPGIVITGLLLGLPGVASGAPVALSGEPANCAAALGLPASAVRDCLTIPLPGGGPLRALLLGLAETDAAAEPEALLVPVTTDGAGAPLSLGPATSMPFALLLDLARPATIDLREAATRPAPAGVPKRPALLVRSRVTRADEQHDQLTLIALEAPLRLLWQAQVARLGADGGGFDSFELTIAKTGRGWPRLHLLQTTLPAAGAADFLPGPPLLLEYRWRGQTYERVD